LVWTPYEPQELIEGSLKSSKISRAIEKENALQSITWVKKKFFNLFRNLNISALWFSTRLSSL
jgi:hypothetical protein